MQKITIAPIICRQVAVYRGDRDLCWPAPVTVAERRAARICDIKRWDGETGTFEVSDAVIAALEAGDTAPLLDVVGPRKPLTERELLYVLAARD